MGRLSALSLMEIFIVMLIKVLSSIYTMNPTRYIVHVAHQMEESISKQRADIAERYHIYYRGIDRAACAKVEKRL